jgi:hypothetical protein
VTLHSICEVAKFIHIFRLLWLEGFVTIWGDIFRIENPSVFGKSQCSAKFFLWEIRVDYVRKVCEKIVYCCLNIPQISSTLIFQRFKLNLSLISHQLVVAEHWDLLLTLRFSSIKMSLLVTVERKGGTLLQSKKKYILADTTAFSQKTKTINTIPSDKKTINQCYC